MFEKPLNWLLAELHAKKIQHIYVAYSGGMDSHVLLHWLLSCDLGSLKITAIHVNHHLQEPSIHWEKHCQSICESLKCQFICIHVSIELGGNIEEKARNARLAAIEKLLDKNSVVLMAHHQRDQAETLLLNMIRGSGIDGLAAIPSQRLLGSGYLMRPFLTCPYEDIQAYAAYHRLTWVEDTSNQSLNFDRNYLRHTIFPLLRERWPKIEACFESTVAKVKETKAWLQEWVTPYLEKQELSCDFLLKLTLPELTYLLKHWVFKQAKAFPTGVQLKQVVENLKGNSVSPKFSFHVNGHYFGIKHHALSLIESPNIMWRKEVFPWQGESELVLGENGKLLFTKVIGRGISAQLLQDVTIQYRQGGERFHPEFRRHSQTLKKLFQENDICPRRRNHIPLIYAGSELVSVAGLWRLAGTKAGPAELGYLIEYQEQGN